MTENNDEKFYKLRFPPPKNLFIDEYASHEFGTGSDSSEFDKDHDRVELLQVSNKFKSHRAVGWFGDYSSCGRLNIDHGSISDNTHAHAWLERKHQREINGITDQKALGIIKKYRDLYFQSHDAWCDLRFWTDQTNNSINNEPNHMGIKVKYFLYGMCAVIGLVIVIELVIFGVLML